MAPKFQADYPGAVAAFKGEACAVLDDCRERMLHALTQIGESDLWWRPNPAMNAPANVVLHVCGNLRQWIIVGCDPEQALPDERDRPGEFAATGGFALEGLADKLTQTIDEAKATIRRLNKDHLLAPRHIQIGDVTGMGAVWHSVSHLEGHTQELIYIARLRRGEDYRFKDAY